MDPDCTPSPADFGIGSDSPVSSDSSISRPSQCNTRPSVGTWSPVRSASTSSSTTAARSISPIAPSRTTRTRGVLSTANRSSVRLARSSWTIPIAELATITPPNRAFCQRPVAIVARNSATSRPLNGVTMFARRIAATVRLVGRSTVFARPASTRRCTSADVSPSSSFARTGAPASLTGMPGMPGRGRNACFGSHLRQPFEVPNEAAGRTPRLRTLGQARQFSPTVCHCPPAASPGRFPDNVIVFRRRGPHPGPRPDRDRALGPLV